MLLVSASSTSESASLASLWLLAVAVTDVLPFAGDSTAFEDGVLTIPIDHFSLQA